MSLKSVHMYRRVPTDLSKASHAGGAISLVAVGAISLLLVSHYQEFTTPNVERSVEIDQVYDESIVVSFNITMSRLPCAFTSLDLTDALGTSVHNVTRGMTKMRIDELTSDKLVHRPSPRSFQRPNPTVAINGQDVADHKMLPAVNVPKLSAGEFYKYIGKSHLAVVLFGTTWCDWTKQFKPVLDYLRAQTVAAQLNGSVEVYHVDCTHSQLRARRGAAPGPVSPLEQSAARLYFDEEDTFAAARPRQPASPGSPVEAAQGPTARKLLATEDSPAADSPAASADATANAAAGGMPGNPFATLPKKRAIAAREARWPSAGRGPPPAGMNGDLCADLHIFSYPTVKLYRDGAPKDAYNWVGTADHDELFNEVVHILKQNKGAAKAVEEYEKRVDSVAAPFIAQMKKLIDAKPDAEGPQGMQEKHAQIKTLREEAIAQGVPAVMLRPSANGQPPQKPQRKPNMIEPSADGAEGCEVSGTIKVQRVPGTLRINAHAHYQSLEPVWVNLTHTVHTLTFAKELNRSHVPHTMTFVSTPVVNKTLLLAVAPLKEGRNIHPLQGHQFTAKFPHSDIAHYVKVIPSSFSFSSGEEGELYLYTANNRFNVRPGDTPSVNIGMDISPYRMHFREYYESWTSFLTSTCAVVGGVFTVFGMVVTMLDTSTEALSKKTI